MPVGTKSLDAVMPAIVEWLNESIKMMEPMGSRGRPFEIEETTPSQVKERVIGELNDPYYQVSVFTDAHCPNTYMITIRQIRAL